MKYIISQARRDAARIDYYYQFIEIKLIARDSARKRYPRGTKQERGIYKFAFIRQVRRNVVQALHNEWSRGAGF